METVQTGTPEPSGPPPVTPKVTAASLLSAIKVIELQVAALKREVERWMEQEGEQHYTLADLKGIWAGQGNFSEEEIDVVLYREPPKMDEYYPLPSEEKSASQG